MKKPKYSLHTSRDRVLIVWIVLVILGLWTLNFILMPFFYAGPENAGSAGDMFGGLNALFTGLAFAGAIYAIILQQRELTLTRDELARSADALNEQLILSSISTELSALVSLRKEGPLSAEEPGTGRKLRINWNIPNRLNTALLKITLWQERLTAKMEKHAVISRRRAKRSRNALIRNLRKRLYTRQVLIGFLVGAGVGAASFYTAHYLIPLSFHS